MVESTPRSGRRAAGPEYDAVVVGAGPNGLVAAAELAGRGWRVLVLEAAPTVGGGTRSAELTEPGFVHDVCSAIHPLAVASPAMRALPLEAHGLEWIQPPVAYAHPLDDGRAGVVERSLTATMQHLGVDGQRYGRLMQPLLDHGDALVSSLLSPLRIPPSHPCVTARFGVNGIRSATTIARRFETDEARGVLAGLAAHSMLSLRAPITGGFALFLGVLAHHVGWPMARGGSQAIADSLASIIRERGGEIVCDHRVEHLSDLPPSRAVLLDISPARFVDLAGDRLPSRSRLRLSRFRTGPGVFKIDWALDAPIPWTNEQVRRAGTVHLGGAFEEIAAAEAEVQAGHHSERPYVLLAQQSQFDPTRAPQGRHTAWAYCHVPSGSTLDQVVAIESQVERFAPGFRDLVIARHTMDASAMETYNANYIGGDIAGGVADLRQFIARPTLSLHPWATAIDGVYLCSASTPPGPGVHGMSGRLAAELAASRHG